jgi:prolipoprotein diacylglyceryltransferase
MLDSFTVIFAISALASLIWLGWAPSNDALQAGSPTRLMVAGTAALFGGLMGARSIYVVLHWGYFQSNLLDIPMLWKGGLSGFGGLIGAAAGAWIYARGAKLQFWTLADALARPAAAMSTAIWAGCWMTGWAYGTPVDWGILQADIFGRQTARWPAALLAALGSAGWALILPWLEKRWSKRINGQIACLTLGWLGVMILTVSLLRADPTILYAGIRQETWAAAIAIMLAIIAWIYRLRTAKEVHP